MEIIIQDNKCLSESKHECWKKFSCLLRYLIIRFELNLLGLITLHDSSNRRRYSFLCTTLATNHKSSSYN